MIPTTRSTANIYQPISLRAVFALEGVNQLVSIDQVLIYNEQQRVVRAYGSKDVTLLSSGAYELIVEPGLPSGTYRDAWAVRGVSSSFRSTAQFAFTISDDPSGSKAREP